MLKPYLDPLPGVKRFFENREKTLTTRAGGEYVPLHNVRSVSGNARETSSMNIAGLLTRHARYRPGHPAVVCGEVRLTFAELEARVGRAASALLGLGLQAGDKVATVLGNCLELLEVYGAAARAGLVVVPLSPLLRGPALKTLLEDSDTRVLVAEGGFADSLLAIKDSLPGIAEGRYLFTGTPPHWVGATPRSPPRPPIRTRGGRSSLATPRSTSSTAAAPPDCPRASCTPTPSARPTALSSPRPGG